MKKSKNQKRKERLEKKKKHSKTYMHHTYPQNDNIGERWIHISNDSALIIETNYWKSTYALNGFAYVSCNAGAFRMLIPPQLEAYLSEMKTGKHVVISRGFHIQHKRDMFEFMFEDFSEAPYSLWVCPEHLETLPASFDNGKEFKFLLYSKGLKLELEVPAYYRIVKTLPYLKSWKSN